MTRSRRAGALGATALAAVLVGALPATAMTPDGRYAIGLNGYETVELLSVGDTVPETSNPALRYQMIGIPDGLGAMKGRRHTAIVYLNHELRWNTLSTPVIGQPQNRGPIVSKLIIDTKTGDVLSGERAYDETFLNDTYVGPAPDTTNSTPSFARFCSGFLAGREVGFDRPIYFANEESSGSQTFDGRGGLSVAIFDNEAHGLTDLGRFPWENALVQPGTGKLTVIMGMEDGPTDQDTARDNSQLYMYVGVKSNAKDATVLERNGLVGGNLYVFRSTDAGRNSELTFQVGSIAGEWVDLGNVRNLSETELEAASDAVNAMVFARPEDGAFNPRDDDHYVFVTTGGTGSGGAPTGNRLGRIYSLYLDSKNPTGPATLKIEENADQRIAAGEDTAVSPDNIDVSDDYLMVNEDGTSESRPVMASKGRDGSIWRFDVTKSDVVAESRVRVGQLLPPGRDGIAVGPGVWETSGIIDVEKLFGKDTWLFDVQAHPPTTEQGVNTIEDGQLLLLVPTKRADRF